MNNKILCGGCGKVYPLWIAADVAPAKCNECGTLVAQRQLQPPLQESPTDTVYVDPASTSGVNFSFIFFNTAILGTAVLLIIVVIWLGTRMLVSETPTVVTNPNPPSQAAPFSAAAPPSSTKSDNEDKTDDEESGEPAAMTAAEDAAAMKAAEDAAAMKAAEEAAAIKAATDAAAMKAATDAAAMKAAEEKSAAEAAARAQARETDIERAKYEKAAVDYTFGNAKLGMTLTDFRSRNPRADHRTANNDGASFKRIGMYIAFLNATPNGYSTVTCTFLDGILIKMVATYSATVLGNQGTGRLVKGIVDKLGGHASTKSKMPWYSQQKQGSKTHAIFYFEKANRRIVMTLQPQTAFAYILLQVTDIKAEKIMKSRE